MRLSMRSISLSAALLLLSSANVFADSWNCSYENLVREVVVVYPEGGSLPCTVVYKKQTEGVADEELWTADNQQGYCEDQAMSLVSRLESWGWVCMETIGSQGGDNM